VSDIDTAVVGSLKALDPNRPIREADMGITLAVDNNGRSSSVAEWTTLGVCMNASSYLYTIATLSMTFAGLSVLTMIFRQMLGGQTTKFDSFVTRTWIQLGFMTTFASLLPPLLVLCDTPTPIAWRASSGAMAIILGWWALTFPRRRRAATTTPLPRYVVLFCTAMDVAALAFAADAKFLPTRTIAGHLCWWRNGNPDRRRNAIPVYACTLVRGAIRVRVEAEILSYPVFPVLALSR
jgi:hypothetical protein